MRAKQLKNSIMRAKQSKKETLMVVSKWDITLDILEKIQILK